VEIYKTGIPVNSQQIHFTAYCKNVHTHLRWINCTHWMMMYSWNYFH